MSRRLRLAVATLATTLVVGLLPAGGRAEGGPSRPRSTADLPQPAIAAAAGGDAIVTFGQVFAPGAVPAGRHLRLIDATTGTALASQVDAKASHADGSLRHAVVTAVAGGMRAGEVRPVRFVVDTAPPPVDRSVRGAAAVPAGHDVTVTLDLAEGRYSASAAGLLAGTASATWLDGPLVDEVEVVGPLVDAAGRPHPHLTVRFGIRAYAAGSVRTSVTVENTTTFVPGIANQVADVSVDVAGRGRVLRQDDVVHYRQSRWRRVFWWGRDLDAEAGVRHDVRHLQATGAVPTYDPSIVVPEASLARLDVDAAAAAGLMEPGLMETDMPAGGGRPDIGPLPRWTARYLVSGDPRAERAVISTSEQAGGWPIHYRDEATGRPVSIDTRPDLTILGSNPPFPPCGGECSTPFTPDMAHQPSTSYVPYLLTGDRFHLEELQFWANWNTFMWGDHGGSLGLVVFTQVRAQAWGLRTIAHAAWATPDADPLKPYFAQKVANNLAHYRRTLVDADANRLGHVIADEYGEGWISFWQDDFFTWMLGHLSDLGFEAARPIVRWKGRFAVGRVSHPDTCFVFAPVNWALVEHPDGRPRFDTWAALHRSLLTDQDDAIDDWLVGTVQANANALSRAACGSAEMGRILGLPAGTTIGYSNDPESYSMNIVGALAAAVDAEVPGALAAWRRYAERTNAYDDRAANPHFDLVPRRLAGAAPNPSPTPPTPVVDTGYWVLEADGDVHAFGTAPDLGGVASELLGASAVAMAAHPSGDGFWVLGSNGLVVARGSAPAMGRVDLTAVSDPPAKRGEAVATLASNAAGDGVWVFTNKGRVLHLGRATPAAAMANGDAVIDLDLVGDVTGSFPTVTGRGAYMVAADGGVFALGDATFAGSLPGVIGRLPDRPVTGIVADPDGRGYWMVAEDGGVFAFDAPFVGSLPGLGVRPDVAVNGLVASGRGYFMVAGDGGVFAFATDFAGSPAGRVDSAVVDLAAVP